MTTHDTALKTILTDTRAELLARTVGAAAGFAVSYPVLLYIAANPSVAGVRVLPQLSAGILNGTIEWILHLQTVTGLTGLALTLFIMTFAPAVLALVFLPTVVGWSLSGGLWNRLQERYTAGADDE